MEERLNFKIAAVFQRGITIELENECPYTSPYLFHLYVNSEKLGSYQQNVVSIDGLTPDTEYDITVEISGIRTTQRVRTKEEAALLNVRDFGAAGDGKKDDTMSLQAAVSACPENGCVVLPAGTYYSKPIFLKSNMTLWLQEGAELLGSSERSDYPVLPGIIRNQDDFEKEVNFGSWEGNPLDSFASLITGIFVHDVDIVGRGSINGNGDQGDWWQNEKQKRIAWRPRTVFFNRCQNIRLQNVTVHNSPSWTIHPYYCDHISFYSITVQNPAISPNTDGIDPESCVDVQLLGCRISVGDDCVAIKSGKYYMSNYHYRPTRHVEIRNCLLESGHGSVTIGSEISGGANDIHASKCIFRGTDRGLRIKTRRGRGQRSIIENISFTNIRMEDVRMPLTVGMFYFCDPDGHSEYVQSQEYREADDRTPRIGEIRVENVTCEGVEESFVCMYGLPEQKIGGLFMKNVSVSFKDPQIRRRGVPLMMDGFPEMSGKSIFIRNAKNVELQNVVIQKSADKEPELVEVDHISKADVSYND